MIVGIHDNRVFVSYRRFRALTLMTIILGYGARTSKVVETIDHIKRNK